MFLKHARHIWEKMKEVEPTAKLAYNMYHDGECNYYIMIDDITQFNIQHLQLLTCPLLLVRIP